MITTEELTEYFEEYPQDEILAFTRACRKYGVEVEYDGENLSLDIDDEEAEAMEDDHAFRHLFAEEAKRLIVKRDIQGLVDRGYLIANGVSEDGEIQYVATDKEYIEED